MSENTKLWESVEKTDPKYTKEVKYPYKHSAIDAHYRILTATKLWGSFGSKWGVKNETYQHIKVDTGIQYSIIYTAILFYPDGELPIASDIQMYSLSKGEYKLNNDYIKKVATDSLTKGLSKLGFSADVFMGAFDGNKYEGITSFKDIEPEELATPEQLSELIEYSIRLESVLPDKAKVLSDMIKTKKMTDKDYEYYLEKAIVYLGGKL